MDYEKVTDPCKNTFFHKIMLADAPIAALAWIWVKIQTLSNFLNFHIVNPEKMLTDPLKTIVHWRLENNKK